MLPIINILLIVGILLFILYNLYVDTRNWSNTGSFLEGMENAGESIDIEVGNSNTNSKTVTLPHQNMTVSPIPINPEHEENNYSDTFEVSVSGNQLTVTRTDSPGGWGQQLVLKGTVGENPVPEIITDLPPSTSGAQGDCERDDPSKVTGVKYNGGDFPWDGTKSQEWNVNNQKQICEQELGKCFKNWNADGKQGPWCYEKSSTGAGSIGEAGSTDVGAGTANDASSGSVSSAGSAASAMEDQIKTKAGDVAPMGSNVSQNCKKGCVAPTGPNGNCSVIQQDGAEKRECYYGCPNPTLEEGDTENCAYDSDCNSCGTKIFNPDDPPDMSRDQQASNGNYFLAKQGQSPQSQQITQGAMTQGAMTQGAMTQGTVAQGVIPQGAMAQVQMNQPGSMENSIMDYQSGSTPSTISNSYNSLFNENIMKLVLAKQGLIPSDINSNNEETSYNSRIGKQFMIHTATIRNFALPNIDEEDYIELGRIVKNIKMRENDPREADQVKALYSKLNIFVLELLTDSSLDMQGYDNSGIPRQINNKTRTTGMFGENSNSLIKERVRRHRIKPYDSIWSLYQ